MDNLGPSAADVSGFYDVGTQVLVTIWGESFHAGYWTSVDDPGSDQQAVERMEDEVFARLGVSAGSRVLDVGCGIGTPAFRLAETTGARVLGISIDQAEIDLAASRAESRGLHDRITFEYADALSLPYPDNSFDAAMAIESLIHMNRLPALREIARVVRPGGPIVITDLRRSEELTAKQTSELAAVLETMALTPMPTLSDYRALVAEAGLRLDELTDISDHTRHTSVAMADSARYHYDDLVGRFGRPAADVLEMMMNPPLDTNLLLAVVRAGTGNG